MKKILITLLNDYNKTQYVVNEDMIKTGIDTRGNQDFFTNATQKDFETFSKLQDENQEVASMNFYNYIDEILEQGVEFVWEDFYTDEEIKEQGSSYTNVYDNNSNEVITIDEYVNRFDTEQYLEYWDGSNWQKEAIEGISEENEILEHVITFQEGRQPFEPDEDETGLSDWHEFIGFNYELYKCNDTYYLVVNSFYQGKLDYIECTISESELLDRFDYEIEE